MQPALENILDISTKPVPLCSPLFSPSNEPHYTSLAPLYEELAYLSMLFIPWLMQCASAEE